MTCTTTGSPADPEKTNPMHRGTPVAGIDVTDILTILLMACDKFGTSRDRAVTPIDTELILHSLGNSPEKIRAGFTEWEY
jgi:hypothetical protein